MATENQIDANRLNAQHCTGPKTEEGKARSSQNALKTGIYSRKEVTSAESREDYEALLAEYHDHFAPATPQERSLVDALVRYEWLSRRYMAADTALWNFFLEDDKVPNPGKAFMHQAENFSRAGRLFTSARRGFAQTLKELEAVQANRLSAPQPSASDNETAKEKQQNKPVASKLVSFRQPEILTPATPEPVPGIPPLAA